MSQRLAAPAPAALLLLPSALLHSANARAPQRRPPHPSALISLHAHPQSDDIELDGANVWLWDYLSELGNFTVSFDVRRAFRPLPDNTRATAATRPRSPAS